MKANLNKRPVSKDRWSDHFTRLAKKERFPARSVYKLKEIQQKFGVIRRGDRILDLGCAPGSWLLLAAQLTGETGSVAGIDLVPVSIELPSHVRVFTADVLSLDQKMIGAIGRDYQVVLSDMAPATTGRKDVDTARSFLLCLSALEITRRLLVPGGSFVCKIFQGTDFSEFTGRVSEVFRRCRIFKPQSSRKPSKEIYIIGLEKI